MFERNLIAMEIRVTSRKCVIMHIITLLIENSKMLIPCFVEVFLPCLCLGVKEFDQCFIFRADEVSITEITDQINVDDNR